MAFTKLSLPGGGGGVGVAVGVRVAVAVGIAVAVGVAVAVAVAVGEGVAVAEAVPDAVAVAVAPLLVRYVISRLTACTDMVVEGAPVTVPITRRYRPLTSDAERACPVIEYW